MGHSSVFLASCIEMLPKRYLASQLVGTDFQDARTAQRTKKSFWSCQERI